MAKSQARDPELNRTSAGGNRTGAVRNGASRGPNRAARRRGDTRRPWWRHPAAIIGSLIALAGIGFLIQSHRAGRMSGAVQRPTNSRGPGGSEVIGSVGAPVLVEIYGDFQCSRCGQFQRTLEPQIRKLVDQGKVRLAYYPALTRLESLPSANAGICAGDQGAFWPYHDYLFAHQLPENSGAPTSDQLIQFGRQVGINSSAFDTCVRSGTYNGWVHQISAQSGARGVRILPAIFVNGRMLSDPFSALAAIQEALKAHD
jgi:protein-disulfide isomerase